METIQAKREYLRCPECLGVWAVQVTPGQQILPGTYGRVQAFREALRAFLDTVCPHCGSEIRAQDMGEVREADKLTIVEGTRPECDGRCTYAMGPVCDCHCKGCNHGAGILAEIEVNKDNGRLETKLKNAPKNPLAALYRLREWLEYKVRLKTLDDTLEKGLEAYYEKKRQGIWVPNEEYQVVRSLLKKRADIKSLGQAKSHPHRIKKAKELLEAK